MKETRQLLALAFATAALSLFAGPRDDAIVALMRLSEQRNYTWTTLVSDDARSYEIDAKTCATGYTVAKMPVVNSIRRRLGRDLPDTRLDVVFHGNAECVLRTEKGWFRPDELPAPEAISDFERLGRAGPGSVAMTRKSAATLKSSGSIRTGGSSAEPQLPAYSNLQLAVCPPHEELGIIVSSHRALAVEGDQVSGELTNLGAQLLLVRDGQPDIAPVTAMGTFRIWLRGGFVSRYQLELEGALEVTTPKSSRVTVIVHQRTTTTIRDINATDIQIPDAARAKLATTR